MSENGEIYTAGKNFTLSPAATAWTNSTSAGQTSKYVLNIEGWFRIERDGLTVTWIRFPDHKCLSRNRFPKDLVNNMPLYTTAVNCVLAFSQQANFYLQQKVGGTILRWYKRCVWDQISQELGVRTLHWQSTFLCIAMTATGDRLLHFLSFCNWALYSRCADLINDKYPLRLLNHTLIQLPDCTDKVQQVITGIYMLGIFTI